MIRSLTRLTGAIAIFALLSPAQPSAAPAPGLAYDEIVRVVINATPPPPGNFQNDLAAINTATAASTPTPAPKKRGIGLGSIASAVLGGGGAGAIVGAAAGDLVSNAMENAMEAQLGTQFAALGATIRGFLTPHLLHYSFYNGWERVDDVTAQTATIRKCDVGQVIMLDLAKKSYAISDPASEAAEKSAAPTAPPSRKSRGTMQSAPSAPGTAALDFSATTKSLGAQRIENVATSGYDSTAAVTVTKSTGSCSDGSFSVKSKEYFAALNQPNVTSCPARRAPIPQTASELMTPPQSSGGCRPTLTFHQSGPALPKAKLPLYSLVTMNGSGAATPAPAASGTSGGIAFLTERGNLKTLDASAGALFDVPAGFTKAP